jgi:uncharacterized integral membrane protein
MPDGETRPEDRLPPADAGSAPATAPAGEGLPAEDPPADGTTAGGTSGTTSTEATADAPVQEAPPDLAAGRPRKVARTRVSASWTAVVAAVVILILLVVFIAQNTQRSSVNFLWLHGHAPTAVVLLIAAVAGAVIVLVVGVARIIQLRRTARRARK